MSKSSGRPNILFICSDQQHWRMNSINGHPLVQTPNLARLAAMGVNFRSCYCNSPVCAPARASLMSGRYPSDVEAYDNASPFDGRVPTFGNIAREQGYYCTATGKMDLWTGKDYGFEEVNTEHGHDISPDVTAFFRNPMCFKGTRFLPREKLVRPGAMGDRRHMETTREFLRARAPKLDRPWLAWTGWTAPHNPYRTTPELMAFYADDRIDEPRFPEGWQGREHPVMAMTRYHRGCLEPIPMHLIRAQRAAYYGMITEIDGMVGELLDTLERTGQMGNTVVVFTTDHGDMMGEHGIFHKNVPYDGCARVPLVVAGPGFPQGVTIETPVSHVDLFSTIVDIVGGRQPEGARGKSLLPLIRGDASGHPFAYVELNTERLITGVFTVVQGDWKYNYYVDYPDQLFNLRQDPDEWNDRAQDPACREIRDRMRSLLFAIVNPEKVSDAAFAFEERRLDSFIGSRTLQQALADPEFFGHFSRRLGPEQAQRLLTRHFQRREARSRR